MKPLEGVRILDFTQAHAGSLATMILADFGAEVIKIERAGVGDLARYWEPMKDNKSGYYAFLNRNKKSIGLNAASEKGKDILYKLVEEVDVICENFKFGSMERMGLDYETLKKIKPDIIYASLNAFGQTGILKERPGLDLQLQAMSGIMDRTGFPDSAPTKAGAALGDHLSGIYMAMAINLALITKKKNGQGQRIDISILDSLCSILEENPAHLYIKGSLPQRSGNTYPGMAPYDTFKAKDGHITVAVGRDKDWTAFCEALNIVEFAEDSALSTNEKRVGCYDKGLREKLQRIIGEQKTEEVERLLTDKGVPCCRVCTITEAMKNPQLIERGMLAQGNDKEVGPVIYPGVVIKMSKTPGEIKTSAPLMGEHSAEYLNSIGYSKEDVLALIAEGIIEIKKESKI